jgi:hypothetical protein
MMIAFFIIRVKCIKTKKWRAVNDEKILKTRFSFDSNCEKKFFKLFVDYNDLNK